MFLGVLCQKMSKELANPTKLPIISFGAATTIYGIPQKFYTYNSKLSTCYFTTAGAKNLIVYLNYSLFSAFLQLRTTFVIIPKISAQAIEVMVTLPIAIAILPIPGIRIAAVVNKLALSSRSTF